MHEDYVGGKDFSTLIKELRFPLAVMVVMLHSSPNSAELGGGISDYVRLILHGVCDCAVPLFFLISGYLFFINIETNNFLVCYKKKISSRVKSILVPYMIWNSLYIIFHALQSLVFKDRMLASGKIPISDFKLADYISCFWHCHVMGDGNEYFPINIPLWYLRDLFILCLATPILWYILNRMKHFFILLIVLVYVFTDWKGLCTGLTSQTLVFFSTGALLGMCKIQQFPRMRWIWLAPIIFIIFLLVRVFLDPPIFVIRLSLLLGCIAILSVFGSERKFRWFSDKSQYTMIIYVTQVFWLSLFNLLYHILLPQDTNLTRIFSYFVLCFLTVVVSILCLKIGRKIMPKTMKVLI